MKACSWIKLSCTSGLANGPAPRTVCQMVTAEDPRITIDVAGDGGPGDGGSDPADDDGGSDPAEDDGGSDPGDDDAGDGDDGADEGDDGEGAAGEQVLPPGFGLGAEAAGCGCGTQRSGGFGLVVMGVILRLWGRRRRHTCAPAQH